MVVSGSAMAALESWTWMAPETRGANRIAYDERADLYSYAMLLYHLVKCVDFSFLLFFKS